MNFIAQSMKFWEHQNNNKSKASKYNLDSLFLPALNTLPCIPRNFNAFKPLSTNDLKILYRPIFQSSNHNHVLV